MCTNVTWYVHSIVLISAMMDTGWSVMKSPPPILRCDNVNDERILGKVGDYKVCVRLWVAGRTGCGMARKRSARWTQVGPVPEQW